MLSINFRVNLKPVNTGLLTDTESLSVANTREVFIPGLLGGENILKNHGEIFTLTGQKAIYLKDLIEKNNITNIEVYTGPIEEEVIESLQFSGDGEFLIAGGSEHLLFTPITEPDDFGWTPPFKIFKTSENEFYTDYNPEDYIPSTTNTYYVDLDAGNDANAGTENAPFQSIYQAVHNRSQNILVYIKPGIYRGNNSWRAGISGTNGGNYNVVVRRWGSSGRIVSSLDLGDLIWTLHSGNVWKATVAGVTSACVVDTSVLDSYGNGVVFKNQSSIANVESNPGSSHYAANTVYIRTFDSRQPDVNITTYSSNTNGQFRGATLWLEHCDFLGGNYPFLTRNFALTTQKSYYYDCKFLYGLQAAGGLQVQNSVEAISYQCEASNNMTDGFKYISDAGVYRVNYAEIECRAYNAGIHNTTNVSNGSSSHDGCKGIRINSVYAGSQGRPVHDIANNRSWLLGCSSGPSNSTVDSASKAAFACGTGTDASKMWLDGCTSLSSVKDCEAATTATIFIRDLNRTANSDIGTVTTY